MPPETYPIVHRKISWPSDASSTGPVNEFLLWNTVQATIVASRPPHFKYPLSAGSSLRVGERTSQETHIEEVLRET